MTVTLKPIDLSDGLAPPSMPCTLLVVVAASGSMFGTFFLRIRIFLAIRPIDTPRIGVLSNILLGKAYITLSSLHLTNEASYTLIFAGPLP